MICQCDPDPEPRVRRVVVSRHAFVELFREDVSIVDGIPADAEVEQIYSNAERDALEFVISHDSFDPVQEGDVIPRKDVLAEVDEPKRTEARVIDPEDVE